MIAYIKRKDLNTDKYDACVENSIQSRIYAYSWYLDIVADHWDVLVLDDYEAVMPIPWRKKLGIRYVYTPLRVLELGVFSILKIDAQLFLNKLSESFLYVSLRLNIENYLNAIPESCSLKQQQYILLNEPYESILKKYRRDRKKDLKKASKAFLKEKWGDSIDNLIQLFKENVGKRFKNIKAEDYLIISAAFSILTISWFPETKFLTTTLFSLISSSPMMITKGIFLLSAYLNCLLSLSIFG